MYPKEAEENLQHRAEILQDKAKWPVALEICKRDPVAFFNMALFTYDPRDSRAPHKPFITWDFQDEAIKSLWQAIYDGTDMIIEKSIKEPAIMFFFPTATNIEKSRNIPPRIPMLSLNNIFAFSPNF